jgi:Acyl-protein synthetase, LuxE
MRQYRDQSAISESSGAQAALFAIPCFGADNSWRQKHLRTIIAALCEHHYENCAPYRNILNALGVDPQTQLDLADQPYLPIGLFKRLALRSVAASEVLHTLTSSGTSRSARSHIFVDRETSILQMRALWQILTSVIGAKRLPLLIVDAPRGGTDPTGYAARSVAIQGFSLFASGQPLFALTEDMTPALENISEFLRKADGKRFLIFGFSYVIWKHFLEQLADLGKTLDLSNGILIHGGGWKRLADRNVDDEVFKSTASQRVNLRNIYNYYGMVEQPGSIYLQCDRGFFHCSNFSEIIIRRANLSIAPHGEPGIIQTISALPKSYPGHNLLTEDLGVLRGEDDCACGRSGKYFEVLGRLPAAEPKGCGDVPSNAV